MVSLRLPNVLPLRMGDDNTALQPRDTAPVFLYKHHFFAWVTVILPMVSP